MSKFSINNPAFLQMACVKKGGLNIIYLSSPDPDPTLLFGSLTPVTFRSIKNGEIVEETYQELPLDIEGMVFTPVNVSADANTEIQVIGDVTFAMLSTTYGSLLNLSQVSSFDISNDTALKGAYMSIYSGVELPKSKSIENINFTFEEVFDNNINISQYSNLRTLEITSNPFGYDSTIKNLTINNKELNSIKILGSGGSQIQLKSATVISADELTRIEISDVSMDWNWQQFVNVEQIVATGIYDGEVYNLQNLSHLKTLSIAVLNISTLNLRNSYNIEELEITSESDSINTIFVAVTKESFKNDLVSLFSNNGFSESGTIHLRNGDPYNTEISSAAIERGWSVEYYTE